MKIKYLKHNQIDKQKWDSAIEKAENGLVYAFSWYLDIVSPGWEALIAGDYEIVMPLPVKKKYGISYIIQPPFTQQLGAFYKQGVNVEIDSFLNKIPQKFKYIDINLNTENFPGIKYKYLPRINYELNLNNSYDVILNSFSTNTKRNIKKAQKHNLKIIENLGFEEVCEFKKKYAVEKISKRQHEILKRLVKQPELNRKGRGYSVINENREIISAVFLIEKFNRLIYLISTSNKQGKEKSAMFLLINELIANNANTNLILDFEGGVIPGMSRFFRGFGAYEKKYYRVVINRLPWPLNYIKE